MKKVVVLQPLWQRAEVTDLPRLLEYLENELFRLFCFVENLAHEMLGLFSRSLRKVQVIQIFTDDVFRVDVGLFV